jgi:hypothetical protein
MLKIFSWLVVLVIGMSFSTPVAFAQAPLTLPSVEVDLWPEYDDPGVLVIYRISLPSTVSFPAEIKLRIPAAGGRPNAVAARQPDGSLMNANYTQQPYGAWNELRITATSPELQVEYYDPSLRKDGEQRSFTYEWPGDYAVQAFTVQVQKPWDAAAVQISPNDFGSGQIGGDGLTYYTENIGAIPAGPPFKIQLNYKKPSDQLSVSILQQATATENTLPVEANPPASLTTYLPWVIALLGLVLLIAGGAWLIRSRQTSASATARKRTRRKSSDHQASALPAEGGYVYCPQCGRRAAANDRYCRTCGSELRRK